MCDYADDKFTKADPGPFADDVRETPGIRKAIDELQRESDRFGKLAVLLEERLESVLTVSSSPYPEPAWDEPAADASSVIAGQIDGNVAALRRYAASLDRLIQRIDL